jgi:membrane dipeptidase
VTSRAPVVDAHLDIAMNILVGRDYDLTSAAIRKKEKRKREQCMVTLRELEAGNVAVAFGTLYTGTNDYDADGNGIYKTAPEESARKQLDVYLQWEADGKVRIIRDRDSLEAHLEAWRADGRLGIVVLIEGGDSITSPDALAEWWNAGVRVIGPAWSSTRYCGGTRRPGPLTPMGRDLVVAMRELGCVLDMSHIAEQSFWDAIELGPGRLIASHSNARALVPGRGLMTDDRHLTDDMIRTIGDQDGVIGINLFNGFLTPEFEGQIVGSLLARVIGGATPVIENGITLDAVRAHAEYIANLIGWHRVGIGSDLDGGLGLDETPVELTSAADLGRIAEVVPPEAAPGVLGGNWLRFLGESLPASNTS